MPGPWDANKVSEAKKLLESGGLDEANKAALSAKISEFDAAAAPAPSTPAIDEPAGDPRLLDLQRQLLEQNRVIPGDHRFKSQMPTSFKPEIPDDVIKETFVEPMFYLDDPKQSPQQNEANYGKLLEQGKASQTPVYRMRDLGDDAMSKAMKVAGEMSAGAASAGIGVLKGRTAGLASTGLGDEREQEIQNYSPISSLLGRLGGAVSPRSIPSGIARMAAPTVAAATAGGRIAQGIGAGAKAALGEGALEETANAARGQSGGPIAALERLGLRGLLGAGLGGLSSSVSEAGGAVKKGIERGKLGTDLKRVEAGFQGEDYAKRGIGQSAAPDADLKPTSVLRGVRTPSSVERARDAEEASGGAVRAASVPALKAADEATTGIKTTMDDARNTVAQEKQAYQASPEGKQRVSSAPLYRRIEQILERDKAEPGAAINGDDSIAFGTAEKLRGQLKKLRRAEVVEKGDPRLDYEDVDEFPLDEAEGLGVRLPTGASDETHSILVRPVEMNAAELDRQIRAIDEIAKEGAATSTAGTRELGELGAAARKARDNFLPNEIAPKGYSALKGEHRKLLVDLDNKLVALGLPKKLDQVDVNDEQQVKSIYSAIRKYGDAGNETTDKTIDAIGSKNPRLARALREKLTMDAHGRLTGAEDFGASGNAGGIRGFITGSAIKPRLHALGDRAKDATPARLPASVNPIYGPLGDLFRRNQEEKSQ